MFRVARERTSGRKALDAYGLHHSGFDVARGTSGVGKNQKLDLERHPEKARATHREMRAKDRPLANDFLSDAEFEALPRAWFGNAARVLRPGGGFYVWGGFMNLPNYVPALKDRGGRDQVVEPHAGHRGPPIESSSGPVATTGRSPWPCGGRPEGRRGRGRRGRGDRS